MEQTAIEWIHELSKQREPDKFDWNRDKEIEKTNMKTYILNMTLSTPKNIEESEILDKLVQFAEDNNYLLGGGLQLVDEVNPKDHCNYSGLPSPSSYNQD